ncbi:hypothetical protein [Reyranella sp.]|uniref:hypothetical protein n=1 Tax=Reyranella sp. TaxID=1929291 RepID=UPI003D0B975A
MANEVTVADVVVQARKAAEAFDGPRMAAMAIQEQSPAFESHIAAMASMQDDILAAATEYVADGPDLEAALAALKAVTDRLNATAAVMTNATSILSKANALLGYGSEAVSALRGGGYAFKLGAGKMCTNRFAPHPQPFPYPAICPVCGSSVL